MDVSETEVLTNGVNLSYLKLYSTRRPMSSFEVI